LEDRGPLLGVTLRVSCGCFLNKKILFSNQKVGSFRNKSNTSELKNKSGEKIDRTMVETTYQSKKGDI